MTKKELQEELTNLDVEFDETATVAELTELLEDAKSEDNDEEELLEAEDADGNEVEVEEVPEGSMVMRQRIKHDGCIYEAGVQYDDVDESVKELFTQKGWCLTNKLA